MNNKSASSLSLRKLLLSALVVAPLATLPTPLWAVLPSTASTNLTSTAGASTTFSTSGTTLTITTPDRTVLNWGAFGVDAGDTVGIVLPAASSSVLNRVTGGAATTIAGNLTSNGALLVLNDAGIVVSGTGNITASNVVLSTIPETEYNYLATGSLAGTGTPAVAGDISATGVIRVGQTGTVSLIANDVVVGGTVDAGTLAITSKANVTPTMGTVALNGSLIVGNTASSYGNVTIATNGGGVDLGATAGTILISGGNLTVNTGNATTGGNIIETNNGLTIGNGTSAGNLTLDTRTGTTTAGTATVNGVAANGGAQLNVTLNTGTATLTDTNGDIQLNAGTASNLSVTATNGNIKSGGNVTSATVALLSAATAGKSITYSAAGNTTFTTITSNGTGSVTVSGTANVTVGSINSGNVTLGGTNLAQTAATSIVAGNVTIQSTGNATLTQTNDAGTLVIKNNTGTAAWVDGNAVTLGNGTSVTGNASVTGTAVTLGSNASDTISVGGALTLSGSSIVDLTDNASVSGALNITSTGAVTLDGAAGTGLGLNSSYGVVNVSAAGQTVTLLEKTTLSLGNISATDLRAYSASDIANTGKLVITGTLTAGAGTASAPGAVAINYSNATVGSGNQIANIRVLDDNTLLGLTGLGIGNYLASSLTVTNENGFGGITIPANIYGTGLSGNVTLTDVNNVGISNGAGVLILTGTLTLNEKSDGTGTGTINLNNAGNKFSAVTVNSTGPVTVSATGAYTANASLKSSASAVSFTSTDAITIGTYSSLATGATTFTTGAGKALTDSVAGISIFGPISITAGTVSITRAGHNFGAVSISSTGNATIVEGGFLNLNTINTGTGAFSGTSSSGNIIDSGTLTITGNASFSAASGAVVLDSAGNNFGNVSLTASGNSTLVDANAVVLSDVTVSSGTLAVNTTGAITQLSGKSINVYGATTFTSGGANAITLGNSGNRFGALTLTTTNGAVTVKEMTTVNLASVNTGGAALTVTSEGGSILDSGTILATGSASFTTSAANATIVLDSAANDFGTVTVSTTGTGGNVTLTDGVGNLVLGASSVGGSLLVNQTSGNISQGGPLSVFGDSTFNATAAASSILLTDNQNQLGALKFVVGTGGAIISELTSMNLRAGTVANGQVTLNTGGNFVTSGTGGSTFLHNVVGQQSLVINATGTITPGTGSLVVRNGLTVNSAGAKDLSGLSLSGSLFGVNPTNQGTGSYTAPSP